MDMLAVFKAHKFKMAVIPRQVWHVSINAYVVMICNKNIPYAKVRGSVKQNDHFQKKSQCFDEKTTPARGLKQNGGSDRWNIDYEFVEVTISPPTHL